jgi:hypothetical protein
MSAMTTIYNRMFASSPDFIEGHHGHGNPESPAGKGFDRDKRYSR